MVKEVARPHKYSVKNSDEFTVGLGGKDVKSVNKILSLTDDEHEELQDMMAAERHDISSNLTYLDEKAAEKIAKDYLASHKPQAGKGPAHTTDLKAAEGKVIPVDVKIPEGVPQNLADRLRGNANHIVAEANKAQIPAEPETFAVLSNEELAKGG